MYINQIWFLTSIGYPIYYRNTPHISDGKKETLYENLDKILCIYNSGGYRVNVINCDNGFRAMMDDVKDDLNCTMNFTNAQDHGPHAETNNPITKTHIRVGLHRTMYKMIPCVMICHLIITSTQITTSWQNTACQIITA